MIILQLYPLGKFTLLYMSIVLHKYHAISSI